MRIENLSHLKNLKVLDLSYNNIKVIEGLHGLDRLEKLYLLSNKIKKIENLALPALDMLELGSNKISEIENLDGLPNLTSLFLGKNRITEIKGLEHLKKLRQVSLGVIPMQCSPTDLPTLVTVSVVSRTASSSCTCKKTQLLKSTVSTSWYIGYYVDWPDHPGYLIQQGGAANRNSYPPVAGSTVPQQQLHRKLQRSGGIDEEPKTHYSK